MGELSKLKGLGPESEKHLNEIGIFTREDLERIGAVQAFIRLVNEGRTKPGINFLYAMAGALQDRHWIDIARTEKDRLLLELDALTDMMNNE